MLQRIHLLACLIAAILLAAGPILPALAAGSPERFVEICSGFGIKQIAVDQDGTLLPDQDNHPEIKKHCPFCVVRTLAALSTYTPPVLAQAAIDTPPPTYNSVLLTHPRLRNYCPRGPPALI